MVHRYLAEANPNQNTIGQQASVVYLERLEQMLRAVWPQAIRGDLTAVRVALRILAQEARFHGLAGSAPDADLFVDAAPWMLTVQNGGKFRRRRLDRGSGA